MQYVPLHLHSEYSLLDGAIRLKDLCKFAKENDMPAVALTDHGVMYGVFDFYRTANEIGIKPLIGCEFYVYDGEIDERNNAHNTLNHLVLIAKNKEGYQNLIKLTSISHIDGFYYKPRINHKLLEKYCNNLICLSACIQGEVSYSILEGEKDKAKQLAKYYKDLFKDDYYIELQDHGLEKEKRANPELIKLAKELDIKMVITNDSHYLKKEDSNWHDTLLCIQTNSAKHDENRFKFPNDEFYVKTVEQLRDAFNWLDLETFEAAIKNTVDIAEKCHLIIEKTKTLPAFDVPKGHSVDSYLNYQVLEGLKKRYEKITPDLENRYKYELGIIEKMGFSAYFLIVWDFIRYAHESGVPVGPGRGSAAGSLVAYALGITELDPIKHNLLFERFLNPERISMPDVDVDFCIEGRQKIMDYVAQKYGTDHVCQIITFGSFAARNALKAVARVYEIPFADSNIWASLIPSAPGTKIDDAMAEGMELRELYDHEERVKSLVDMAKNIEGLRQNIGIHAAGVIISCLPLNEVVPVQYSKDGNVITEYAMADIEKLGLLKMDFLGLRNLTIIRNTMSWIKKRHNIEFDINRIPLDDEATYNLLMKGDTDGVFQLESPGMKKLVKDLRPTVFEDLGALVALFRPGPLNSGMVDDFVQRKHGKKEVTYAHPLLEPVLKDTYGTIVYQEQIMQIFQVLAGYSLGEADMVRRMMGKKKLEEMAKQKERFIENAAKNNMPAKAANELFEQIEKFAEYCFNRSHSAAYAFVAYQTAYLKAHYPNEYLASLLSSVTSDQDKTQLYITEAQKLGIKVLPPDINKSSAEFTPDENNIRFGLSSIKGVGLSALDLIIDEREKNGEFTSIVDFLTRVDMKCLNKKTLESLIKCGAFSNLEPIRKKLLNNLENMISLAQKEKKDKELGQTSLFAGVDNSGLSYNAQAFALEGSDEEFDERDIQQFEKELLGFYVTSHPLESIRESLPFLTTHNISDLLNMKTEKTVTVCGLISQIRQIPTKKDPTKYIKVGIIEDLTSKINFVAFFKTLQEYNSLLESERKVILSGKVSKRTEEEEPQIIIENVKPVENCNIITISMKKDLSFENCVGLKDFLLKFKGSDPVVFEVNNDRILVNSNFWVNTTNDFEHELKANYGDNLEVSIRSID